MTNGVDRTKGTWRKQYAGFIGGRRINALSLVAEAWFWRVHAQADDFGNLPADPALLWASTRGRRQDVTPEQVRDWVEEMVKVGLLIPYRADEADYLHVDGFEEMQAARNGKPVHKYPEFNGQKSKNNPELIQAESSAPSPSPRPIPDQSQRRTPREARKLPTVIMSSGDAGRVESLRVVGDRGEEQVRYMLGRVTFPHVKPPAKDRIAPNLIDDIAAKSSSSPCRVWKALQVASERSAPGAKSRIDDPVAWLVVTLTGDRVLQITEADAKEFNQSEFARVWAMQQEARG